MTHATPMMMPSAVSVERSLLRAIAFRPTLRIVRNFNMLTPLWLHGRLAPVGDRSVLDDLAVTKADDAPRVFRDVLLVGDQHDGLPLVIQCLEDRHDLLGGL